MFYIILISSLCLNPVFAQKTFVQQRTDDLTVAESAYLNMDLFKAEFLFKEFINKNDHNTESGLKSLNRLFSIAQMNRDKRLFVEILNIVKNLNNADNELYYSLMYSLSKYFFQENDPRSSIKFSELIKESSSYYLRGLYIKGSCFVLQKKYKDALIAFDNIVRDKKNTDVYDVKDLAVMAKARIFMLQKRYEQALVEYQSVSELSPYYLVSLKELIRVFVANKDYENAILSIDALLFIKPSLYGINDKVSDVYGTGYRMTDFELMELKTLKGYIYIEQGNFDEANLIFNDVISDYNISKRYFTEELNRFKVSEDITQLISFPYPDGSPRSLITNIQFVLFDTDEKYSELLKEWLEPIEKEELKNYLSIYYSLLKRTETIKLETNSSEQALSFVVSRNLLNKYLHKYIANLIKTVNSRMDDVGLKARLAKLDITWKIKEQKTKTVLEIQERKLDKLDLLEQQYKRSPE